MATLTVQNNVTDYGSVFLPMQIDYAWQFGGCIIGNSGGRVTITTGLDFQNDISVGDFVQVLNGSYKGTYKVLSTSALASSFVMITDGVFISLDSLSNKFNLDVRQGFELYAGYATGAGATIKPYQKIADISIAINPITALFEIDLQSYLRSYFTVDAPTVGKDYALSLRYDIKPVAGSLNGVKYAYYSAETIDSQIIGENVPLGEVPLTYLNQGGGSDIPTLFSVIESTENTVLNVVAGVGSVTTTSDVVNVSLVVGQAITINIVKTAGTWGTMTLDPVVSWANITATVGNTVTIVLDSNTTGVGDYASVDYSNVDYLTTGLNSIAGNYAFNLLEDAVDVGDINVSIYPTLQIRRICKANSLNFAWLNKSGGRNSYAIECKFIKGFDVGSDQTFLTATNVLKRSSFDDVYENYTLTADLLTTFELDLLSSLRTSIQAFLYNDATLNFDIPIILDRSSFQTYGNRQRQTERSASFSFRLATKQATQTQ
jgi:hypothetical protein